MSQTLLNIPINYIFKNNKETRVVVVRRPDNLLLSLENVQIHKHDDDEDAIDLKKLGIDIQFGELDRARWSTNGSTDCHGGLGGF